MWAVHWLPGSEWVLATGGGEGAIRLWDIRRAGAFMVLDLENATEARQDSLRQALTHPAAAGVVHWRIMIPFLV